MNSPAHPEADRIVSAALGLVAEGGLDGLTMRDLARAVGKSTTVIVNQFGAKQGLIEALGEAAFEADALYHQTFLAAAAKLALSRDALAALAGHYLRERASASASFVRVWEELLLVPNPGPRLAALMRRWETMRRQTWAQLLAPHRQADAVGAAVSTYLTLEQFYAGALAGRLDYEMIVAEGLGGLADRLLDREDDDAAATESFIEQLIIPRAPAEGLDPTSMKVRLLDVAADQILSEGLGALTNRSVSTAVGTSTSTIAYHWPDMDRFIIDAVWHAVFREMPEYLDHRHAGASGPPDVAQWGDLMVRTLTLGAAPGSGFYVKYAKLIAQICLKARRDPAFAELAMILRGPEGGGTYVGRAEHWPPQFDLSRRGATRFALWIKGAALLSAAGGHRVEDKDVVAAAALLTAEHR